MAGQLEQLCHVVLDVGPEAPAYIHSGTATRIFY